MQLLYHVSLQGKMAAATNGRIFAPYRAIGLCCNHVPMCMYARGDSILVATAVGKAHHVYNVSTIRCCYYYTSFLCKGCWFVLVRQIKITVCRFSRTRRYPVSCYGQ